MTLSALLRLVEEMIRENPDCTVRDYVEVVKEITGVEEAAIVEIVKTKKAS